MKKKKTTIYAEPTTSSAFEPAETTDMPLDGPTSPVEATTPVFGPVTYVAGESDSYASIAADFLPGGYTKHQYAVYLAQKNGNKPVRAGSVITL